MAMPGPSLKGAGVDTIRGMPPQGSIPVHAAIFKGAFERNLLASVLALFIDNAKNTLATSGIALCNSTDIFVICGIVNENVVIADVRGR